VVCVVCVCVVYVMSDVCVWCVCMVCVGVCVCGVRVLCTVRNNTLPDDGD
jgi:hypothetical protein